MFVLLIYQYYPLRGLSGGVSILSRMHSGGNSAAQHTVIRDLSGLRHRELGRDDGESAAAL